MATNYPTNQVCPVGSLSILPRLHSFPLRALARGSPLPLVWQSAPPENVLYWVPGLVGAPNHTLWVFYYGGPPHLPPRGLVLLWCWLWVLKGDPLPWPSRAGTRGLGLPPIGIPLAIFPSWGSLWLHPHDLLHGWSQLWECWWSPCFILVTDWLSLLICSSSRLVAASAHWWVSLASVSS